MSQPFVPLTYANLQEQIRKMATAINGSIKEGGVLNGRVDGIEASGPGADGYSNARVFIFRRSVGVPALPSVDSTYAFATGALTGLNNGWSMLIPTGTDTLYVSAATASSNSGSDIIAASDWASPVVFAENGAAGLSSATIFLYQRNGTGTPPAVPGAMLTYTFATGLLGGALGSWTQTVPAEAGGKYLFVTTATALGTGTADTIATGEWAAVRQMAVDGSNGTNGNIKQLAFRRAATQPATPSGGGIPSGWSATPPIADGNSLWMAASEQTPAGAIVTAWGVPVKLDGDALVVDVEQSTMDFGFTYGGVIKDGQLPRTNKLTARLGSQDISSLVTWSKTDANCTTTISSTGSLSVTGVTANGSSVVRVQYGSFDTRRTVQITRTNDPAPPAAIVDGGNTIVSTSTLGPTNATTYPASPISVLTVRSDTSGQLQAVVSFTYGAPIPPTAGSRDVICYAKCVYRVAGSGGAWNDFGTEASGSIASSYQTGPPEPETGSTPGACSLNQTKTGLTGNINYEVGMMARRIGDTSSITLFGTATFKQPGV